MYNTELSQKTDNALAGISLTAGMKKTTHTWIIVANHFHVRIFENRNGTVNLIYNMHRPEASGRPMRFSVQSGKKPPIVLEPTVYCQTRDGESLTFAQKISARMDEALWSEGFERLFLITEAALAGTIYSALSYPVRARMSVYTDRNLPGLATASLLKRLPEALLSLNHSFHKGQYYDA